MKTDKDPTAQAQVDLPAQMAKTTPPEADGRPAAADPDPTEATRPALPPSEKQTFDEVMADLGRCPLFMTDGVGAEDNVDIAALQALNYEGTPLENGTDFKARGNACFEAGGYADAREFYTRGIQVLLAEEQRRKERGTSAGAPSPEDRDGEGEGGSPRGRDGTTAAGEHEVAAQRRLLETLHANRAACHLALANHRSCWTDCAAALRLNPSNVKACFRGARALLRVDRVGEAREACARGLALDPESESLRGLFREITTRQGLLAAKREEAHGREAAARRREALLAAALRARNIPTRSTARPPQMEDARLRLVPDEDDPTSGLAFPTVLLYPDHLESDFIKAFGEGETLQEHLGYVFPLPWDTHRVYTLASVSCYLETRDGGVLRLGRRVPLLKALGTGKVEVVDGVLRIYVVPRVKADAWVDKFKRAKAAQRAGERAEAGRS